MREFGGAEGDRTPDLKTASFKIRVILVMTKEY